MNSYIKMQLNTMLQYLDSFEQACQMAAMEDDGTIDKAERKQIEKIQKACEQFRKDLSGIR
ncbi:MAG: hypothetical protein IJJ19_06235 [Erysipelotrichaceae bacterium]|nr:hypothetical protein [Erysipelotrichaceae bacterium]